MRNFNELPKDQEQEIVDNNNEAQVNNETQANNVTRNPKLLKSLLLGLALVIGPSQAKAEDAYVEQKPAITSTELSSPETIKKVKAGLVKLAEGDNSEKRWLAENALREIELNELVAEKLTKKHTRDELPPDYLKGFIKDTKVLDNLNEQALKKFQEFHYDKNGKETEEYLELSVKERIELHHQLQAECIYNYLVQTDGLGIANLRVLKAEKYYKEEQEQRALEAFKKIMDIQEGKYVTEYPDWLKSVLREDNVEIKTEKKEAEVEEITEEKAKEIRELIKSLLNKPKE
jgi:hypothetical protein